MDIIKRIACHFFPISNDTEFLPVPFGVSIVETGMKKYRLNKYSHTVEKDIYIVRLAHDTENKRIYFGKLYQYKISDTNHAELIG